MRCRCSKKPGAIQEIESAQFSAPLEQLEGGKMQAWGEKPQRHGVVTGDIVGFVPGGKAPAALSSTLTYAANYEYESKPGTAASAKTPMGKAPAYHRGELRLRVEIEHSRPLRVRRELLAAPRGRAITGRASRRRP